MLFPIKRVHNVPTHSKKKVQGKIHNLIIVKCGEQIWITIVVWKVFPLLREILE